jgi:hypothetical protein
MGYTQAVAYLSIMFQDEWYLSSYQELSDEVTRCAQRSRREEQEEVLPLHPLLRATTTPDPGVYLKFNGEENDRS